MSLVYKIQDGTIMRCRKRLPPREDEVQQVIDIGDVASIEHRMDGDEIHILLCDRGGRVLFDIERDHLYPPGRKLMKANRFHRQFWEHFLVPIATDKVFSTIDLEQMAPRINTQEYVVDSGHEPANQ